MVVEQRGNVRWDIAGNTSESIRSRAHDGGSTRNTSEGLKRALLAAAELCRMNKSICADFKVKDQTGMANGRESDQSDTDNHLGTWIGDRNDENKIKST